VYTIPLLPPSFFLQLPWDDTHTESENDYLRFFLLRLTFVWVSSFCIKKHFLLKNGQVTPRYSLEWIKENGQRRKRWKKRDEKKGEGLKEECRLSLAPTSKTESGYN
jgi:hypothetical protein